MGTDELSRLAGLNEFIEAKLKEWNVPGLAIGIVKDGEVVLTEGFGFRNISENLKVTPETILAIGSASKSFTSMALGMLVDEGKLEWDKPIREYMPFFKMHDPFASDRITVRDMLCHRTGLPRHDFMWINSPFCRREIVERVRYLEPNADFRSVAQYQNHMYITAGYLVEAITGMTWEQFVKERILEKLGMENSNFSVEESQLQANYAKPYSLKQKKVVETEFLSLKEAGPAGSINSTAVDMAKWVLLQLGKGKYKDEQIVSEGNHVQMHTPYIPGPNLPWNFNEIQLRSYGLAWFIEIYRGHKIVHHGGNTPGFTSLVSLMPDKNLGIVILTNMNATFMPTVLTNNIFDRILGLDEINWSTKQKEPLDKMYEMIDTQKEETKKNRKENTVPSHKLEEYTGQFENPGYGVIKVQIDGGELKATYNSMKMPLKHYHYDTFGLENEMFEASFLSTFILDKKGEIDSLSVPFEQTPGIKEIVFKKVPVKA